MDPDEDEDSPYVCPYKHAETEQDKKKVWEETKGIAERLRTDMGLDMKGTQEGFMTYVFSISDRLTPTDVTFPIQCAGSDHQYASQCSCRQLDFRLRRSHVRHRGDDPLRAEEGAHDRD